MSGERLQFPAHGTDYEATVETCGVVYDARTWSRRAAFTVAISAIFAQLFSAVTSFHGSYDPGKGDQARIDQVNDILTHPLFSLLFYPMQLTALALAVAAGVLLWLPDTAEFLNIRKEQASDSSWDLALGAARRAAIAREREDI